MSLLAGVYANTPLNTTEIPQSQLDIANKSRSNPLRWSGQFSPQLVQVLLKNYASSTSVLFDPFLGSGTVLLEAGLVGIPASGTEINPAAIMLSQTYKFINVPLQIRRYHLQKLFSQLQAFQDIRWGENGYLAPKEIKSGLLDLSLTINEPLQYQLLETLIILLDFYKSDLSANKLFTTWKRLKKLVLELPFSEQPIEVFHADARQTPLPSSTVSLVITSPPYINVFNYHQQYRASAEALDWDLLKVAPSEFGSNRKNRGNRFLTVIQFCLDITQTFSELFRVSCTDSRIIFVVGRESTVRGTKFFNGEIVAELAHEVLGYQLDLRQERVFRNRFGQNIYEDILHFSPPTSLTSLNDSLETAREVANKVLQTGYLTAPDKAKSDIKLALESIGKVEPSPILNLERVLEN